MTENKTFEVHEQIVENERIRRILLLQNIIALKRLKEDESYKDILGEDGGTWLEYLGHIEIYYPRAQVFSLLKCVSKLLSFNIDVEEITDVAAIPASRLRKITPFLTEKNYHHWLSVARTYVGKDFTIEIKKAKGEPHEEDGHDHDYTEVLICDICGQKHKK